MKNFIFPLFLLMIMSCSKETQQEKPPYPKGSTTFEGEVLFNGEKLEGIGDDGSADIYFWRNSSDTIGVGFGHYRYKPNINAWHQYYSLGLSYGIIPSDSVFLQNSSDNPSGLSANVMFTEMDHDMLFHPWEADSGFYSLRLNNDSSVSAHIEARLIREAPPSEREEFLRDTIQLLIKGKFIPR